MKFKALIKKVSINNEGETTLIFTLPKFQTQKITDLLIHTQEVVELDYKITNKPEHEIYEGQLKEL